MAVIKKVIRLAEFQTLDILPRDTYTSNTIIQPLLIEGNSILSSVYVKSMDVGATLKVNYFDTSTGALGNERYDLQSHEIINDTLIDPILGFTDRITVTRIHNKPYCEIIISGGNVEFGIYNTVVSAFASDLDSALQHQDEPIDFNLDKGIPIAAFETTTSVWSFLRTLNGKLQVDVPGVLQTTQQIINKRLYNASLTLAPNTPTTHIDYTVPALKKLYWLSGFGYSNSNCIWRITVDGVNYLTKRATYDEPSQQLQLDAPLLLAAGQRIIITVENKSILGLSSEVETWFYGAEENL